MAKIKDLIDKVTRKVFYPRTHTRAVIDDEGRDLETRLAAKQDAIEGTPVTDVTSADLDVASDGGTVRLALTDGAKLAVFNDRFNALAGGSGGFQPVIAPDKTRPYRLNDQWLSYAEAVEHLPYIRPLISTSIRGLFARHSCKTAVLALSGKFVPYDAWMAFYYCKNLKSVRLIALEGEEVFLNSIDSTFAFCGNLVNIDGVINIKSCTSGGANTFAQCLKLEEVRLKGLNTNIVISEASNLSCESLGFMVVNAVNTAMITITVHPDVYAKLTGDDDSEAYTSLTTEEQEQWTALVALALEKNIAFATV